MINFGLFVHTQSQCRVLNFQFLIFNPFKKTGFIPSIPSAKSRSTVPASNFIPFDQNTNSVYRRKDMFDRGKSKQACGKELIQSLKEDRISQLPDPLICQILSHLPAKIAVRTIVLSTRWRSLWLWVPSLELDSEEFRDFNAFVSFGNRFFDSNRVSCIDKLKITILDIYGNRVHGASFLISWIDAAVQRKIQQLNGCCFLFEMPISLYNCETLVSLKLHLVKLVNPEFVSLPCLKILHLSSIHYPNEATFERLVSSCPVLEELEIEVVSSDLKVLRVISTSLKRLTTTLGFYLYSSDSGIVIDAPRLCFLRINHPLSGSYIITNMDSTVKLDLRYQFQLRDLKEAGLLSGRNRFLSFLSGISKVRDMMICRDTFKLFCAYLKLEPLPQLVYLSNLQVALDYSHSKWLPTFLESFPNLKSLILVFSNEEMPSVEMNQISFSSVPECLLSSLEFVDFKVPIKGHVAEMKLLRYFLEHSVILKRLTIPLQFSSARDDILKELRRMPRGSTKCEVVILDRVPRT